MCVKTDETTARSRSPRPTRAHLEPDRRGRRSLRSFPRRFARIGRRWRMVQPKCAGFPEVCSNFDTHFLRGLSRWTPGAVVAGEDTQVRPSVGRLEQRDGDALAM